MDNSVYSCRMHLAIIMIVALSMLRLRMNCLIKQLEFFLGKSMLNKKSALLSMYAFLVLTYTAISVVIYTREYIVTEIS